MTYIALVCNNIVCRKFSCLVQCVYVHVHMCGVFVTAQEIFCTMSYCMHGVCMCVSIAISLCGGNFPALEQAMCVIFE